MRAMKSIVLGLLCLSGVAQGADLPVKFLSYVESTGAQYVDTGYTPNANTKIEATYQLVRLGQASNYVFGEYGANSSGRCQFSPAAQTFAGFGGGSSDTIVWGEDAAWHTVTMDKGSFEVDGVQIYQNGFGGTAKSLYLFAVNGNGTASQFSTNRISLVKIYDKGVLKRLLVPCEMSDGKVGFWDFVSGLFYGNKKDGNFVGGAEVASTLERLAYVRFSNGTYLDTGIKPTDHETAIRFRDEKSAPGGFLFGGSGNSSWLYSFWSSGNVWAWGYRFGTDTRSGGDYSANVDHTVVYNDVTNGSVYVDGRYLGNALDQTPNCDLFLGRRYNVYNYEGRVYWVKVTARSSGAVALWLEPMRIGGVTGLYNPAAGKLLTQSEGTLSAGPLQAGLLEVTGSRDFKLKAANPAWGTTEDLADDAEFVVAAPTETLFGAQMKVTVTGWKLYEWSDAAMDWVYNEDRANASGTGSSFTYVHSGVATKLEWQLALSNPIATGDERYVMESGDDEADGKSWETAKLSVGAAFAALDDAKGTVCVNVGTYKLSANLELGEGVSLIGISDADGKRPTIDGANTYRTLKLTSEYARAENLRLYRGYAHGGGNANNGGGGLNMSAGTVVNCEFADCYSAGEVAGGSVTLTGGTLSRCSVHGGYTVNGGGNGAGAYVNGSKAVVEHSLFYGNSQNNRQGATTKVGAVYLNAGTVRNCTIVNNNMGKAGGIYVKKGAKFYDSIVWGNVAQNDTSVGAPNWQMESDAFVTNICTPVAMGEKTVERDLTAYPNFKDLAANDCRLMPGSPCIDVGSFAYPADALDLAGNPRTAGTATDLGAYELDANEKAVGIEYAITGNMPGETLTYSVVSTGFGDDEIAAYWNFSDIYPTAEAHDAEGLDGSLALQAGVYSISLTVVSGGLEYRYQVKSGFTVYGLDLKVVDGNPNAKVPYDTWENAAANIADAVALATDGSVITLSNGTHKLTKPIDMLKAFTVQGLTGDPNDVKVDGQKARLCADIKCAGAVVRDIWLYNGQHDQGGTVSMTANGRVDHCIVDTGYSGGNQPGGCIYMSAGTVSRSVVKNGHTTSGNGNGDGVYMDGDDCVLEHSLIVNNKSDWKAGKPGAGVYLNKGTVRNCTISGNTGSTAGGIYVAGNGKVLDTIVWGNATLSDTSVGAPNFIISGNPKITNCWSAVQFGTTVGDLQLYGDPAFVDAENGDYTLGASSGCKDVAWGEPTVELDLAGSNRVQGAAMDLGCYEANPDAFAVDFGFTQAGTVDVATNAFTLTVTPVGTDLSNTLAYWTFDGRIPTTEDHDATGVCVSNVFGAGSHDIAMLVVHRGQTQAPIVKKNLFKVYASRVCLDIENVAGAAKPWNTWENAATNVNEIVPYLTDGSLVLVKPGRYPVTAEIELLNDITFRGVGADGAAVPAVAERPVLFKSGSDSLRAFRLAKKGARVEHLSLQNFNHANSTGPTGGAVYISGGTLADCTIAGARAASNIPGGGVGLSSQDAYMTRCIVTNCQTSLSSSGYAGGGVFASDGSRVDNCLIVDCKSNGAGGLQVQNGGSAENCVVVGCAAEDQKGLCAFTGGVSAGDGNHAGGFVANCVILNNKSSAAGVGGQVWGEAKWFLHNAMDYEYGVNSVTNDPRFADAAHGDWHIGKDSPLVNAGTNLIYTADSVDFEGNPRIFKFGLKSSKPDIGLYETPWGTPGLLLQVK